MLKTLAFRVPVDVLSPKYTWSTAGEKAAQHVAVSWMRKRDGVWVNRVCDIVIVCSRVMCQNHGNSFRLWLFYSAFSVRLTRTPDMNRNYYIQSNQHCIKHQRHTNTNKLAVSFCASFCFISFSIEHLRVCVRVYVCAKRASIHVWGGGGGSGTSTSSRNVCLLCCAAARAHVACLASHEHTPKHTHAHPAIRAYKMYSHICLDLSVFVYLCALCVVCVCCSVCCADLVIHKLSRTWFLFVVGHFHDQRSGNAVVLPDGGLYGGWLVIKMKCDMIRNQMYSIHMYMFTVVFRTIPCCLAWKWCECEFVRVALRMVMWDETWIKSKSLRYLIRWLCEMASISLWLLFGYCFLWF